MTCSRQLLVVALAMVVCSRATAQEPTKTELSAATADGFPLPPGAIHRFGNRQLRHPDGIIAAAVSPDGKLFATVSHLSLVVWDLKTLAAKRAFAGINFNNYGFGNRGGHLSFLPNSSAILVAVRPEDRPVLRVEGPTDLVQVWDIESGKKKYSLKGQWEYEGSAWVTAGGKEIALVGHGGPGAGMRFFDIKDGKELRTVETPHLFSTPWLAPGGDALVFQGSNGEGLGVLDVRTGKEVYSVPNGKVAEATLSRDGKLLAYTDDGKVHVHDVEAKNELFSFEHPEKQKLGPMAISADRQILYFSSNHGRLFRWDLKAKRKGPDFGNRHNFWHLSNIVLSPDESVLYSTSYDHLIKRWDVKTGKELPLPEGYTTRTTLVTSADGKHVILSDHEGQVDFWDLATGKRVKQIQKSHLGGINCLGLSADGRWLAAGRTSQDVRLFDLSIEKVVRDIYLADNSDATKYGDQVQRVQFDSSGKVMFSSSDKTGVTAWEIPSGKKLWNTPGTGPLMAVDPTGRWIAGGGGYSGGRDVRWTLLDAKSGDVIGRADVEATEFVRELNNYAYPAYVGDFAFLPDGSRLLTTHYDGTLRVWEPQTRHMVQKLKTLEIGRISVLACSPDGHWLALGGSDASLSVWELATGKVAFKLEGHHSGVTQVEFTRDCRKLISSADLAPVLWNLCPRDLPAVDGPADTTWEALSSDDAAKAYRLQWALAKQATTAIKLFEERVKPSEQTIDRAQFDKLVGNLDSPQFRAREAAEKEMVKAGYRVPVAWLRKALADAKSDELRTRLTRVMSQREKPTPEEWRLARAIKSLELAGTDEAKRLLKAWTEAPEGSLLAVEAKGALERIAK